MARTRCVLANSQHNKIDASPPPIAVYDGSAQIATSATKPQAMRCSIPVTDQKDMTEKGNKECWHITSTVLKSGPLADTCGTAASHCGLRCEMQNRCGEVYISDGLKTDQGERERRRGEKYHPLP